MTSRRPCWCPNTMKRWSCWCPKTKKRWPCWCPKPVLRKMSSFLMQTLSFVPINLHRCSPREWRHSIHPPTWTPLSCDNRFISFRHNNGGSHPFFKDNPFGLMPYNFGCSTCTKKPQSETTYLTLKFTFCIIYVSIATKRRHENWEFSWNQATIR